MALVQKEIKFPEIKLPKIKLPTLTKLSTNLPKKEYSIAEKFQILCPAWYRVVTSSSYEEARYLQCEYNLHFTQTDRCFLGESHHFSSRYSSGFGSSCTECKRMAFGHGFADLASMYGMSQKDLNDNIHIRHLVNHIEECHPKLAKW